jgi:hopanoid-associated phosphorylase
MTIGLVSGLKRELRCLGLRRPPHLVTFAAAGSPERACARAQGWIADKRIVALISFGLCGGLDPGLVSGALVVASEIRLPEGGAWRFDGRWADAIAARLAGARRAPILAVDSAAIAAGEKARLFARHGAPAVDMESRGVAEAAREADLPFVAIRAVADPAGRSLPRAALEGINAHGRMRPFRVLAGLLAHPGEFFQLLALAGEARRGYAALTAAAKAGATAPSLLPPAQHPPAGG